MQEEQQTNGQCLMHGPYITSMCLECDLEMRSQKFLGQEKQLKEDVPWWVKAGCPEEATPWMALPISILRNELAKIAYKEFVKWAIQNSVPPEIVAEDAYAYADAMLAERVKK